MALLPGTNLGPYCIEETLGAGGMGEVYRARDTRLDRRVAIKVLATQYAASDEMRQRFDMEARTISSLNHPGICHLYDIGHEKDLDFIVMEFLEGSTLADRIDSGPMNAKELLRIAVEVTDALEAAHSANVVHRDLKPGNIMLTPHGAKLMDFGLAKLAREPELMAQTIGVTEMAAGAPPLTSPGSAVGTIAYMSPEQARGDSLDGRSDLFSLGAVLYEALTGKRAFSGKTSAVVFHAILEKSPPPVEEVVPGTPRGLADLIDRLLEKDRELRPQTAGEVRAWLKRIQRDMGEPSSHAHERAARAQSKARKIRATAVAIGFSALVLVGLAVWYLSRSGSQPPLASSLNPTPVYEQLTHLGNVQDGAAISPDGNYVAYVTEEGGSQTVWVRQIATTSAVAIVKNNHGERGQVSFSADSQFVYFSHSKNPRDFMPDVYVVPVLGGETRKVVSNVSSPVGVSKTGQLAYVKFDENARWGLFVADADGSNERRMPKVDFSASSARPSWSPDGTKIAISGRRRDWPWQIVIVDVASEEVEQLGTQHWDFVGTCAWLPDASGIVTVAASETFRNQLWVVTYPDGKARQLTNDLNNYGDLSVSVSQDGNSLVAIQVMATANLWDYSLGSRQARRLTSGTAGDGLGGVVVAPNGDIYFGTYTGKDLQIWKMSADGSDRKQITRGEANIYPSISPDGSRLVYYSMRNDQAKLVSANADGSEGKVIELPFEPWLVQDPIAFSADGKWLYLSTVEFGKMGLWQVPADGSGPAKQFQQGTFLAPSISPDGKLMKVGKYDEQTHQLTDVVFPMNAPEASKTIPLGPGKPILVRWTPDGKGLSYIAEENGVSNVYFLPWPTGQYRKLTSFESEKVFSYGWAPGNKLVVARGMESSDVVMLKNLKRK